MTFWRGGDQGLRRGGADLERWRSVWDLEGLQPTQSRLSPSEGGEPGIEGAGFLAIAVSGEPGLWQLGWGVLLAV